MNPGRQAAAGALALLVLTAGALWLLGRLDGDEGERRRRAEVAPAPAPAPPPAPLEGATVTPSEVADPAQARALELLLERRAAWQGMVDGFRGPASPAALARLQPALDARWPAGGPVRWKAACRGETCRIEVEGAPEGWAAALLEHPAVKAVVDRVVADPDGGVAGQAYLVLAPERAAPGAGVLDEVVRELTGSGEAAACLRGAPPGTGVAVELEIDGTGVTFRASGGTSGEQRECVSGVVGEVISSVKVPPGARRATRTVTVRAAP